MANYCDNSITINGNVENVNRIKDILISLEKTTDDIGVFETLIGLPPTDDIDYIYWWGTRCDNNIHECNVNYEDGWIDMSFDTKWSPPTEFCQKLSLLSNVEVEIKYNEGGCNFAGRNVYNNGEVISSEEYPYLEGIYRLYDDIEMFLFDLEYSYMEDAIESDKSIEQVMNELSYVDDDFRHFVIELYNKVKKD